MASDLVLLVVADPHEADRYTTSLIQAGQFAFIYARDAVSAVAYAGSMRPDLAIIALDGAEGSRLCLRFREACGAPELRLLLVADTQDLPSARESTANAIVVRPASAVLVTVEALTALRRVERRSIGHVDRRHAFRGGRRLTDICVDSPAASIHRPEH